MPVVTEVDTVDRLAGIAPDSPLAGLRDRRPEARRHTEGAYHALLRPAEAGGVSGAERAAVARRVAELNADAALTAHYAALLDTAGEDKAGENRAGEAPSARLAAILRHVDRLTLEPRAATPADLAALRAAGLTERDIVTVSQLVAFVNHQVRLLAGLRLLSAAA